jgi:hypothetical protein
MRTIALGTAILVVALGVIAAAGWWLERSQAFDPKNASVTVEGAVVKLHDGVAQTPAAPGSASIVTTRYFGNEASGDLNGDGVPDIAFLITQDLGGSGTFYYVVAGIKTPNGYTLTPASFVGDHIAPQTTAITSAGIIEVNYADRAPGEPMSAQPSVGTTLRLKLTNGVLQPM